LSSAWTRPVPKTEDNCKDMLATLENMTCFVMERPDAERPKLHTPQAVMTAFPDVCLVIDAREQRVQRPSGYEQQEPFYSGKKKTHTLKHESAVAPAGHACWPY
jgi:DDE superfamily endonuclease